MTSGIKINVTGGAVSIGAVNQGDDGQVTGTATAAATIVHQEMQRAESVLAVLARESGRSPEELEAALAHLQSLAKESQTANKDAQKGGGILKLVRDNFSWAYPAIKDFAKAVWPAILAVIAG